jgi:putative ABC transport system permease protein
MKSNASFVEAISVAIGSLRASKLRSFLTLLGIILATTTLIAVQSVIHGMDRYIATQVSDMGVEGFKIRRFPIGHYDFRKWLELNRKNRKLTRDEFQFLKSRTTLVRDMSIEVWRGGVPVSYRGETLDWVRVGGVMSSFGAIANIPISSGRFFTEADDRRHPMIAFIGNDIRDKFFPNLDPVGKTVDVQGRPFEIIGAASPMGTVFGESRDNFVMIPAETFFKVYGSRMDMGYTAAALNRLTLTPAQDEVRLLMRAYRQLKPAEDDNFGIVASESLLTMWDQLTGAIAATATAVVSVFMVVGGVVIMNIMLAVVTERTHEIGVRKAVGARRSDIQNQFLVESSMLAAAGGLIGVTTAWIVAILVRNFTPVPMALPITSIFLGVGLSAMVGLFFGIYPARRAARLDPIEALRFEK